MGENSGIQDKLNKLDTLADVKDKMTSEYEELQIELAKKQAQLADKTKEDGQEPGE